MRQFIQGSLPEEFPKGSDSWIVLHLEGLAAGLVELLKLIQMLIGTVDHRAELIEGEYFSVFANTQGTIDDRSLACHLDSNSQNHKEPGEEKKGKEGTKDIEDSLEERVDRFLFEIRHLGFMSLLWLLETVFVYDKSVFPFIAVLMETGNRNLANDT